MNVLIDSSIWSLAFRRKTASAPEISVWAELVRRNRARIIGPVRQELLSGIREHSQFDLIRRRLHAFPDIRLTIEHFERAAEFSNRCRSRGVQGSGTDFLICAVAEAENLSVFTADSDFQHFAKHLPIRLHSVH